MKPYVWIVGFPRCGTVSLCEALRILGWNPLHNPRHWDMLDEHDAAGDVLITAHWRELFQMFPGSKFILNTRDVEEWLTSLHRIPGFWKSPRLYDRFHRIAVYGTGDVGDHETLRRRWQAHHRDIRATIPAGQLLEFAQPFAWEPLCAFLSVSVPDEPFPWKNRMSNGDAVIRLVAS